MHRATVLVTVLVAASSLGPSAAARGRQASDPKAELRTGLSLLVSDDPNVEREDAAGWLRRAADGGDVSARFHLANLYWSSLNPDLQDDSKALRLFLEVAKTGDPYAAANAGTFFHEGIGVRPNPAQARAWYEAAARGGLSNPAWRLARMFERGDGVRRDLVEAYRWLDIAGRLAPLATEPQEAAAAAQWRDELAEQLSAAQITRAQNRARAWLAARTPAANCNGGSNRIRFLITVDDTGGAAFQRWLDGFERHLRSRLTVPPCSRIEGRALNTLRVMREGGAQHPDTRAASPLYYFDAAVHAALQEIRTEPLPAAFTNDSVQVRIASFYNDEP